MAAPIIRTNPIPRRNDGQSMEIIGTALRETGREWVSGSPFRKQPPEHRDFPPFWRVFRVMRAKSQESCLQCHRSPPTHVPISNTGRPEPNNRGIENREVGPRGG